MNADRTIPLATYRVQLQPSFGFDAVIRLAPYLARLGISHVYLSPCLRAMPGSVSGYDVVDYSHVNEELGGSAGFEKMCGVLGEHDLGLVLDVIPNHMSIANPRRNPWWWDVLENGPASFYAHFFDVDWERTDDRIGNRVLIPILGDHYGRVLESGQIRIRREGADFMISAYEHVYPVAPISLAGPLEKSARRCGSEDLAFVADTLSTLPSPDLTDDESRSRRHRDKAAVGRFLAQLLSQDPEIARAIDEELEQMNGDTSMLHEILEQQNYRLSFWRSARHDLGYRRFFDINELAALRMDYEGVFSATHNLILNWVAAGVVHGLRIDHADGLRDPERYFQRLREFAPRAWIVTEKILEHGEQLPATWPVDGTTGYDFLGLVNGLFVDPGSEEILTSFYNEFLREEPAGFDAIAREKRRMVLHELLGSDLTRLTLIFVLVCESHLIHRDYTQTDLRAALEEVLVWLPVYRTYVRAEEPATKQDRKTILATVEAARIARPDLDRRLFDFLAELLLGEHSGSSENELVSRFQQLSVPTMAKGLEDTAFFCYQRLLSLNEVGSSPGQFGIPVEEFHRHCERIQKQWPNTMLTTSTHDTKRSEDVRIRIALLSEIPDIWIPAVHRWAENNKRFKTGGAWPDRAMEYHLYQTLVGAWPMDETRIIGHMEKAAREAKVHTSWTRVNEAYEKALTDFVSSVIADADFVQDLETFLRPLAEVSREHSLSQVLLKLCAPGVPDVYQGNEIYDYSLTDPDNRRSVDFASLQNLLAELDSADIGEILARDEEGLSKLWLTHRALELRRERPQAFDARGEYGRLSASGAEAERVVAFIRGGEVVAIAPRLTLGLETWDGTSLSLPEGSWRNVLTGQSTKGSVSIPIDELLAEFPVALMARES